MKPSERKVFRCAIYTRKSTEHNLDLEFNSLDAQREACEACIKSQAHEGWRLLSTRYDDGAFSGASLDAASIRERPAEVEVPDGLMSSLTWDRGTELAHHKRFTVATDVNVYFCDPRSPWQRGSNENTNGLLRQYFPKGLDLSTYSQDDLDAVALKLNTRPRRTLGFMTPGAKLAQSVALTA
mgnify:CR=1 FL=1